MTIDFAIQHCYEVAERKCDDCGKEHLQLAKWLEELKESRNTINRQKAEIESLQKNIDGLNIFTKNHIKVIRLQAMKEFAERICNGRVSNDPVVIAVRTELECIKEMTEQIENE